MVGRRTLLDIGYDSSIDDCAFEHVEQLLVQTNIIITEIMYIHYYKILKQKLINSTL